VVTRVLEHLTADKVIASLEISGPRFANITSPMPGILERLTARAADTRLGIGSTAAPGFTVIDHSQPDIAKEMYVGRLRSTIIGNALVRALEFTSEKASDAVTSATGALSSAHSSSTSLSPTNSTTTPRPPRPAR